MAKLGKLDEISLQLIIKEFNRRKKDTVFKNFRITDYIDSGRYARVYAVEGFFGHKFGGKPSGRKYALRISDDDRSEKDAQKNLRELGAVRQLMRDGQKHIVEYLMYFSVETEFGTKFCTLMPYLSTLSKYENTADDLELAVRCGCDLLPLLHTCMQRHILHRDIKPQNIFFDVDFRGERGLILGDFGEARWDSDGTVSGIGTPATVSPEIACFDDDIKNEHSLCDMYSLGVVMYYYLNNRTYPFGNNEEAHRKRLSTKGTLPPPASGSERLKQLVLKATQYYPSRRFSSPLEMLGELKKCEEYARFIAKTRPDDSSEETWRLDRVKMDHIARLSAENKAFRERAARKEQELRTEIERLKRQNAQQVRANPVRPAAQQGEKRERRADPSCQPEQTQARPAVERPRLKTGDLVEFGSYPQTADGKSMPIRWKVLEIRDGKALLITEKLLDYRRFNDRLTEITWENCTLRTWMNGEFLTQAFDAGNRARVVPVTLRNDGTRVPGSSFYHPTRDQVFALSAEEAERYLTSAKDMTAVTTDYAHTKHFDFDDRSDNWWLRTSGADNRTAVCVNHSGVLNKSGFSVNYYNVAVRPALWLKL